MAVASKLKFSQFVDLLLAQLYDLEQRTPPGVFIDLNEIAKALRDPVPQQWVWDAAKVLASRGLAECLFTFGGGCSAVLSGEGRLFVEEEQGTGLIREYHQAPQNFVVVTSNANQVVAGLGQENIVQSKTIEQERGPAFAILNQIKEQVERDAKLGDDEKKDLLGDIQMIDQQLRKREPNRPVIAALLEPLSQVASIAGHIANLIRLLNA